MHSLSPARIRQLRLRSQRLLDDVSTIPTDVEGVVKDVFAIQAQEPPAARLAVRPRSKGLTASDIEQARVGERTIIRTWAMRGTLHLVRAQDLGWLLPLLGPIFIRKSARRYAQLGLSDDVYVRAADAIAGILAAKGPLSRAQLFDQLVQRDIPIGGQAAYHLMRRAALEGTICYGPEIDGQETFVLLNDWVKVGPSFEQEEARNELARRYLTAYGPAGPLDFATWSGLSVREARAAFNAIADQLIEVTVDGGSVWMPEERAAWLEETEIDYAGLNLLPAFDTYLLGYQDRDLIVALDHAKQVNAGGGLIRPTLIVEGRVLGTWKMKQERDKLGILVKPFDSLNDDLSGAIEQEVADIGRFLEQDAVLNPSAMRSVGVAKQ